MRKVITPKVITPKVIVAQQVQQVSRASQTAHEPSKHVHLLTAFNESIFDTQRHLYTVDGEKYTSVTTLIKYYEEEFNEHLIAHMKAGGDQEKKQAWLKYWEAKREEASWRGNRVHAYAELASCALSELPEPTCKQEQGVYDWYQANKHLEVVAHEFRVYSKTRKLAGTIDLILYDRNIDSYIIIDWKSNKTHLGQSYGNKKLLGAFNDLTANNYNKYRIQQSLYKSILEECGVKVSSVKVVWLRDKDILEKDVKRGYKIEVFPLKRTVNADLYTELDLEPVDVDLIDYTLRERLSV